MCQSLGSGATIGATTAVHDSWVKHVLKRYPKTSDIADAEVELTGVSVAAIQAVLRLDRLDEVYRPHEVTEEAAAFFDECLQIPFDFVIYDYFLHAYVRREHEDAFYREAKKQGWLTPPPERGPHPNIAPHIDWISVRPRDGKEQYAPRPAEGGDDG
jgi:hypothetical protein